uniref:ubiquitinyl hydrolase 1 n=2 Tax=Meloidogyne incognita group TaxID=654580 RepID=A0A914KXT5_MELIC
MTTLATTTITQSLLIGGLHWVSHYIQLPLWLLVVVISVHNNKMSTSSSSRFDAYYDDCMNEIEELSAQADEEETGMTGLTNQGYSCYVNCVLQSLLNTPKFAFLYIMKALKPYINSNNTRGTKGAITGSLSAVADCFWSTKFRSVNTKDFLRTFSREINADFDGKAEEDAHEFQMLLLDRLAEDVNRVTWPVNFTQEYSENSSTINSKTITSYANDYFTKQKKYSSSIVNDIFRIVLCTSTSCPICLVTRINFEELINLSVSLATDGKINARKLEPPPINLITCLNTHFELSTMERSCSKCGKQEFLRSLYIWRLPEVLIIHIKRFNFEDGQTVKDSRAIDFPIDDLDMRRYIHPASPDSSKETITLYSLYAIVAHTGTANTGHYTARVKNLDRSTDFWQLFDDLDRRELQFRDVKTSAAYMLYYARNAMSKVMSPEQISGEKRHNG